MEMKGQAGDALLEFICNVEIPIKLHTDDAKKHMGGQWKMVTSKYQIKQTLCEPYSAFQNRAEGSIREIKKAVIAKQ